MMLILKLGYRNLWRNRRRTLLTMSAMAVATALLILTLGIYDGMLWDMIDGATDMYHGHVKITAKGYNEQHKLYQTIPEEWLDRGFGSDPRVRGVAGRVRGFALLSSGEGEDSRTQPAELLGIDPAGERSVTLLHEHVIRGVFVGGSASHDILLGKGLAKLLETDVGGEVVAMGQGADGSVAADVFNVAGIIDTGDPVRDSMLAVAGRKTIQEMFALEGRLHELSISLHRSLEAKDWADEKQAEFPDVEVTPWNDFLPQVGQILKIWGTIKLIFAVIFYFAVILVSANTMYMALLERMREFGIMAAVGMKQKRLARMIVLEGFLMSGIAGVVGGAAGILGCFYLKDHYIDLSAYISTITYAETVIQPRLRAYTALDSMLMPIVVIIVLGVLVALFPARKLKRHRPVDVLREV